MKLEHTPTNSSESQTNPIWINLSKLLHIEEKIINIIEENKNNIIEQDNWKVKRIILNKYLTNKIFNTFWENGSEKIKNLIKNIIKKQFLLKKTDIILFLKWDIIIIPKNNDKRFNWIDEENIKFLIHEFLKDFNQNNILYNVVKSFNLNNYSKEELKNFIDNHNTVILEKYIITIQNILKDIQEDIDIEIIRWIAWKLFRNNYDTVINELSKYFLHNFLDLWRIKDYIINIVENKIDFTNKKIDFLELNDNLENTIQNRLLKKITNDLEKNTWIDFVDSFSNIIFKNIDTNYILKSICEKINKKIIHTISDNLNNHYVIKNIETFLSYYSWEIQINSNWNNNIRIKYPVLYIKWINKSADYINDIHSNNYKFILSKLIEIIKKIKRIENRLISINNTIEELKNKKQIAHKKISKIKMEINKIENEIKDIRTKNHQKRKEKEKLEKILKLRQNKNIIKKIWNILTNKEKDLKNKIKELTEIINWFYKEISKLRFKLNTLNQKIKYIKQHNSINKYIKEANQVELELKKYTNKLEIITKDLSKELGKRKTRIQ